MQKVFYCQWCIFNYVAGGWSLKSLLLELVKVATFGLLYFNRYVFNSNEMLTNNVSQSLAPYLINNASDLKLLEVHTLSSLNSSDLKSVAP